MSVGLHDFECASDLKDSLAVYGEDNQEKIRNILERYAISVLNNDPKLSWLRVVDGHFAKMVDELKAIAPKQRFYVNDVVAHITKSFNTCQKKLFRKLEYKIDARDHMIIIGKYFIFYDTSIFLNNAVNPDYIVESLMRIHSTLPSGQQWAVPRTWFEAMESQGFKISMEAFASPFNRTADKYCSLFEEDIRLGSMGNFFKITYEMLNINNEIFTMLVNPPFIELYLTSAAEKINSLLDQAASSGKKMVVVFNGPGWDDADFVKILKASKHLKAAHKLKSLDHSYTDYTNFLEPKSIPVTNRFGTHFFVLSSYLINGNINWTAGYQVIQKVIEPKKKKYAGQPK